MFLDGRQPIKYGLKLEMDEKYSLLKEELSKLCGLPSSRLLLVDMYASNIRVSGTVFPLHGEAPCSHALRGEAPCSHALRGEAPCGEAPCSHCTVRHRVPTAR